MSGLALHDGQRVLAEYVWRSRAHHTVELAPEIALMMHRNELKPEDLSALAVAAGPGSYTGLRIGMALAKGLALTHKLPLVGVPTLDILAQAQPSRREPMLALLQAGRNRLAGVMYKWQRGSWRNTDEGETFAWEELLARLEEPLYICGELTGAQRKALEESQNVTLAPPALCVRRPSILADMAWERVHKGKVGDAAAVVPTYLGTLSPAKTLSMFPEQGGR
jgi:tRNA threonylcarbamoyladenosine biosynthesis protein TsaB